MNRYLSLYGLLLLLGGAHTLKLARVSEDAASANAEGLHLIRIQKTGGTTFGERVMRKFCKGQCKGLFHLDWNRVNHTLDTVVMLRDPVERTLSEFFFLRTKDGKSVSSGKQWNFNNDTWLRYVKEEHNVDDALEVYLHGYPHNPSMNRQSLYLLGFNNPKQAGEMYEWEQNHDALVERAKAHLDSTTVFGIADCYEKSIQAIATKLGWPVDSALKEAKGSWRRKQVKEKLINASFQLQRPKSMTPTPRQELMALQDLKWRNIVHPEIVEYIQKLNAVDMELLDYARQRFSERFGMTC